MWYYHSKLMRTLPSGFEVITTTRARHQTRCGKISCSSPAGGAYKTSRWRLHNKNKSKNLCDLRMHRNLQKLRTSDKNLLLAKPHTNCIMQFCAQCWRLLPPPLAYYAQTNISSDLHNSQLTTHITHQIRSSLARPAVTKAKTTAAAVTTTSHLSI